MKYTTSSKENYIYIGPINIPKSALVTVNLYKKTIIMVGIFHSVKIILNKT